MQGRLSVLGGSACVLSVAFSLTTSCGPEREYGSGGGNSGERSAHAGQGAESGSGDGSGGVPSNSGGGDAGADSEVAGKAGGGTGGDGNATGGSSAGQGGDVGTGGSDGGQAGAGNSSVGGGAGGEAGSGPAPGCPPGVLGHCAPGAKYPEYAGYTLALVEDFEEPLDLDNDPIWTWSDGAPADSQTGFRKEQIKFEDGYMTLRAEKPAGCNVATKNCIDPRNSYAEAQSPSTQASIGPMGVWSGELRSRYNNYRYGRYEVRMQPPNQPTGNYLATMYLFRTPKNVVWTEIDVMLQPWKSAEVVFGNAINFIGPGGPVGYPNDPNHNDAWEASAGIGFDKFAEHTYAFTWMPDKIEWFVDGKSVHSFSGEPQNLISTKSAKIMMNLWVFINSDAFGDPSKNVYPMVAKYDWFRFYRASDAATEPKYPCSPTPSCLPADDKTKSSQNNPSEVNYGQ